jgi:hypothetical protein
MAATDIHLEFPDDKTRDDFEIAFRGWLKMYQQQATVAKGLMGGGGGGNGGGQMQGSTGGLQAAGVGGGGAAHHFGSAAGGGGGGGGEQGLFSLGGGSASVGPYGGSVKDLYLNFIGGW